MSEATRTFAESANSTSIATGAGFAAGLAGIAASSCCVLPILLVGMGLGSVGAAVIPALAVIRPYLLGAAVIAVVAAWLLHARRRRGYTADAACATSSPMRRAPLWLSVASLIVLLAIVWQPLIEPYVLAWMR